MQLIDRFLKFEYDNSLLYKECSGFYYWGYLRFYLYREIERKIECREKTGAENSNVYGNKIIRRINQIRVAKSRSPMKIQLSHDILYSNHERRMMLDGEYKPIYFYSLIEADNSDYALFEPKNLYGEHYESEAYHDNTYYYDELFIKIKIYCLIRGAEPFRKEVDNIINKLEREFGIELDIKEVHNYAKIVWSTYVVGKEYINVLLRKIKPKCIIEVVHYATYHMIINEVAHELGIPVFELQHGGMGYNHIAYNYLDKIDRNYFPNKILLYSDFWKETTRFPIPNENVISVGYPHMDNMLKKYGNLPVNKDYKTILFISQRALGKQMSCFAISLCDALEKSKINYKIIYKLHPNEVPSWKNDLPALAANTKFNIEVVDNAAKNIYEYYSISDVQIGVSSTGVYEGLAFNLVTFILKLPGWEVAKPLCDRGYAKLVCEESEVVANLKERKRIQMDFWKHNATENILREIKTK